ncbi:MFS transporter [Nocardioides zeae]|uniref:MFS family arabinose efflux permease n=1 Tax=Nocardioides zeae TaxID=1457234 RepID=A0AAJ1X461_9ACTN|nr:MFS transporter [Nocardioides zeae]MDQ1105262.1 putative MFS family arabinose efflux permease [Nocardioides zeae]
MTAEVAPPACPGSTRATRDPAAARRLVIVFAVTSTLAYGAMSQSFSVLLVPMATDLGVTRTAVAGAATVSTIVGALAALPVGSLLDRWGGRMLMTTGSVVGVLAVVAWSRAADIRGVYLAFALVGMALAMSTYEAAFAVLVAVADAARRDGAILAVTMAAGLATSFYYPLTGWLETQLGWRGTLLVHAAALAVVAVPAHFLVVPDRRSHRLGSVRRGGTPVGAALRNPRLWLLGLALVAQAGAVAAFLLLMVGYFVDVGHSPAVAATLPVVVGIMQITSRLCLAPLARRFGMARVATVAFAVQGTGLLLLPLVATSVPLALVCVACVGVGLGVSVVAKPSIVADTFGVARFASIVGLLTVPVALSRAGAPLGAAWLGDWRFLVASGAASLVGAAALGLVARRGLRPGVTPASSPDVMRTTAPRRRPA